jgi:hypothetical protein
MPFAVDHLTRCKFSAKISRQNKGLPVGADLLYSVNGFNSVYFQLRVGGFAPNMGALASREPFRLFKRL